MATPEFLAAWRGGSGVLRLLAQLDLPRADGTQVDALRAATGDTHTAADSSTGAPTRFWQGLILDAQPLHHGTAFGSTDVPLATWVVTLRADDTVTFPADVGPAITTTPRASLATHAWLNARISAWRYFHHLGDFRHAQCVLYRAVVLAVYTSGDTLRLQVRQAVDWNLPVAQRPVTRHEFPRAPESAVGLSIPTVLGDHSQQPFRRPWTTPYHQFHAVVRGGDTRFTRAIALDTGRSGQATKNVKARAAVAGHNVVSVGSAAVAGNGSAAWIETEAGMAMLQVMTVLGGTPVTIFNTTALAGVEIPESDEYALLAARPSEIVVTSDMAENGRAIVTPSDVGSTLFDYGANLRQLQFKMATPARVGPGTWQAWPVVGYHGTGLAGALNLAVSIGGGSDIEMVFLDNTSGPIVAVAPGPTSVSTGLDWPDFSDWLMKFRWNGPGPAGKARVFFVGMLVNFRPIQNLVESERTVGTRDMPLPDSRWVRHKIERIWGPLKVPVRTPAVTELVGKFYANPIGLPDDGAGLYTGTPSAVIERAPDLVVWLLVNMGGVPMADIERGATTPGSFVLARSYLRLPSLDPGHALAVGEGDVLEAVRQLAADSLMLVTVSPYDGRTMCDVWRDGPAVTYPWLFGRDDVVEPLGPEVDNAELPDIVTDVRVAYDYDARSGNHRSEVVLGPDRSVAGYAHRNLRDENMEVVANVNDRFDFKPATSSARTALLDPGRYTPIAFAQHVRGRMVPSGYEGLPERWLVGHGFRVVAGYNDRLTINDGSQKAVFIPAADYVTGEDLAAAAQAALNAGGGGASSAWVVTYALTATGGKFSVSKTTSSTRTIVAGSGPSDAIRYQSGWATLGFHQLTGDRAVPQSPSVLEADDDRLARHMWLVGLYTGTTLLFRSGTYGTDSATAVRHCGDLLGFDASEDALLDFSPNGGRSWCGQTPKGDREAKMKAAADVYGRRREMVVRANSILRTDVALALRNRLADLFRGPRPPVRWTTRMAPDVRVGDVVGFREEMQRPYTGVGSDGLWVGKPFVVVEVSHDMGPTSLDTTIVAVDASPLPAVIATIGAGIMLGAIVMGLA